MLFNQICPFVRFCASQTFDNHLSEYKKLHVNYDNRIYYCIDGDGEIEINGKIYHLSKYDFILFKSGSLYKIIVKPNTPFKCTTVNFDYFNPYMNDERPIIPDLIERKDDAKIREKKVFFKDVNFLNGVTYLNNFIDAGNHLSKIENYYHQKSYISQIELKKEILSLLLTLINQNEATKSEKDLIIQILDFLDANNNKTLTNKDIAEHFGYHQNYLSQLFKKKTGYSLHHYILQSKMEAAAKLLLKGNTTLQIICDELGIRDTKYFSRLYKKYYGVTPKDTKKTIVM